MHDTVIEFARRVLRPEMVAGLRVLEVGSYDVNGSLRPTVEALGPAHYVGTDMRPGPGVDRVVAAADLRREFGADAFDLVVCAEMLEHAHDWPTAIEQMRAVLRPGGHLLLTARSLGFKLHDFPADYWRFEVEDFAAMYQDYELLHLERDTLVAGAFLLARRPLAAMMPAPELDQLEVWSMADGVRRRYCRGSE